MSFQASSSSVRGRCSSFPATATPKVDGARTVVVVVVLVVVVRGGGMYAAGLQVEK